MSTNHDFSGKTVFITGASTGVGEATAHAFHDAGANVVMVARRLGPLEEAAKSLERSLVLSVDVQDVDAMATALDAAVEKFGGVDGIVNNAGVHYRGRFDSRTPEEIGTMIDVNLRAPLVLSRMALGLFPKGKKTFVVNVASLAGKIPLDGAATYSSSKFGLRAFTYAMAEEFRGSNTTFSVVSPGPINTQFIMEDIDLVEDITFSQTMCTAEDVADMILNCAADGKVEREFPPIGGKLATLGYLFPALRRNLKPRLAAKGKRVKEKLRAASAKE